MTASAYDESAAQIPWSPGERIEFVLDSKQGAIDSPSAGSSEVLTVTSKRAIRLGVEGSKRVTELVPLERVEHIQIDDVSRDTNRLINGLILLVVAAAAWFGTRQLLDVTLISLAAAGFPGLFAIFLLSGYAFPEEEGALKLYTTGSVLKHPLRSQAARRDAYLAAHRLFELIGGRLALPAGQQAAEPAPIASAIPMPGAVVDAAPESTSADAALDESGVTTEGAEDDPPSTFEQPLTFASELESVAEILDEPDAAQDEPAVELSVSEAAPSQPDVAAPQEGDAEIGRVSESEAAAALASVLILSFSDVDEAMSTEAVAEHISQAISNTSNTTSYVTRQTLKDPDRDELGEGDYVWDLQFQAPDAFRVAQLGWSSAGEARQRWLTVGRQFFLDTRGRHRVSDPTRFIEEISLNRRLTVNKYLAVLRQSFPSAHQVVSADGKRFLRVTYEPMSREAVGAMLGNPSPSQGLQGAAQIWIDLDTHLITSAEVLLTDTLNDQRAIFQQSFASYDEDLGITAPSGT